MIKTSPPHILLVNPWIHDFAAYDFWAKPLGLLTLGAVLEQHGARVSYMDCLDRFHKNAKTASTKHRQGRGPYLKTPIQKPKGCEDIPRQYCRYGIKKKWFESDLNACDTPDLILVTSMMTYWYPGVFETIGLIKDVFPDVPLVLGGIYAGLCFDHAVKNAGANQVVKGPGEFFLMDLVELYTGWSPDPLFDSHDIHTYPIPALHLQKKIAYAPILASRGCPYKCAYCASRILQPKTMRRSVGAVSDEIIHWHKSFNVNDFAFYDDALLVDDRHFAVPILKQVIKSGIKVRFHTPNALHIREITKENAELMVQAGFHTIRLGLETTAFEHRQDLDKKVTEKEFLKAVGWLLAAGFKKEQVGAYLLAGLPGQTIHALEASIRVVKKAGITPVMAHYTPIPHTPMWEDAVAASRYDIESDPIFTNNAVFPCMSESFSWQTLTRLKDLIRRR